jgi:m7GpppX diphosphatase
MVSETPEVYKKVVVPYIESFPPERLDWYVLSHTLPFEAEVMRRVYKILEGKKEVDRVLYKTEGEAGFLILPDMKWDQTTISALVSFDHYRCDWLM